MMINMEKLQPIEVKKIGIVATITLLLLAGVFVMRLLRTPASPADLPQNQIQSQIPTVYPTPSEIPPPGVMEVKTDKKDLAVGESVKATVTIKLAGEDGLVSGADAILTYDPALLSADEVQTLTMFANYPRKTVDNVNGKIIVTGFGQGQNMTAGAFFDVQFSAKKSGRTTVKIDFAPGSTNRSTIAQKGTGKNILGRVEGANIKIYTD